MREGRLFKFEVRTSEAEGLSVTSNGASAHESPRKIEHFWLCGRCAGNWTLALEHHRHVVVVPLKSYQKRRAIAS
jgi:hypothetical protein